jgi:hypothetical protein
MDKYLQKENVSNKFGNKVEDEFKSNFDPNPISSKLPKPNLYNYSNKGFLSNNNSKYIF